MKTRSRNPRLTPEVLKHWRKDEMGWTQVRMASELGTSQVLIHQWENGLRFPPFYLGFALNWLKQQNQARPF